MLFQSWSAMPNPSIKITERCFAAMAFAVIASASACSVPATPTRSLDDAFLTSEALQTKNIIGAVQFPVLSSASASSRATSSGTASKRLSRRDLLALQAIANNPDIKLKIAAAWTASNPKSPNRAEHGFWICRDLDTGELYTRPFDAADDPGHMIPGAQSIDAIAFFHTHPFPGVPQGPSVEDEQFADLSNMPGIIRSRVGLHYFGPAPKPWQPR